MTAEVRDERMSRATALARLLRRPEMGAIWGVVLVFVLFFVVAKTGMFTPRGIMNWTQVSAQLGIVAIGACLLMIAGEFDLSVGSMIAFSGMMMALMVRFVGLPAWAAILLAFVICLSIGWLIGVLVVTTKLPSFIVSLAFLYILRGATIVTAREAARSTLVDGLRSYKDTDWVAWLFGGQIGRGFFVTLAEAGIIGKLPNGTPEVAGLPMVVVWCLGIGVVATFVLSSTRFGNWIFAAGGDPVAARSVGVPVGRVKILLFVFSAFCATVFGASQVFDFGSADASRGLLKEFEAIIAAVIGGALLTGGYGSVAGALLGALIFGVVSQGFFYTGVDGDWFRIFLGCVLLGAVMFNTSIRKRFTGGL
jgi:simple sugar transport system permease protein